MIAHVVAGVLIDAGGRILIAQRPAGKHLAGGWEFPGGKLEPGEARAAGLARELREELGVIIAAPRPLIRVQHTYPHANVLLDVWVVGHYSGEPEGLDGQHLRWCSQDELETTELLPADGPIVRVLRLPERLRRASSPVYVVAAGARAVSDDRLRGVFCTGADDAVLAAAAGAEFIALRAPLGDAELAAVCDAVRIPVFARGTELAHGFSLGASGVNEISETPDISRPPDISEPPDVSEPPNSHRRSV